MRPIQTRRVRALFSFLILVGMLLGMVRIPLRAAASNEAQEDDLRVDYSDETGRASFIGADPGKAFQLQGMAIESVAPLKRPMLYLEHFSALLGLGDPGRELRQEYSRTHDGRSTTRYQQVYEGVPIMGGELIVNLDARGALLSISGEISPDLSLSTTPEVAADDARTTALQTIAKVYDLDASDLTATEPELWIYDQRLLRPSTRPVELVWRMDVTTVDGLKPIKELVLINAVRGGISLHFNQVDTSWSAVQDKPPEAPDPTPTPTVEPADSVTIDPTPTELVPTPTFEPTPTEIVPTPTATAPTPTAIPPMLVEEGGASQEPFQGWGEGDAYYVKPGGDDDLDCLTPANACETVIAAMGKAASGDTIYLAIGTYTGLSAGTAVVVDRNLLFSGGWDTDFTTQAGFTVIDGQDVRGVIGVNFGVTTEFEYIKISNGAAIGAGARGGGIYNSGTLTLRNCIVTNNDADFDGGGIFTGGTLTILGSEISYNHSSNTGGAMLVVGGSVYIYNSTLSGNSALNVGGIFTAGALTLNNVTIANNTAVGDSGGLVSGGGGSVTMSNTVLADNYAPIGPDCTSPTPITTLGYNLIEDPTDCAFTPVTGDITGVDPGLIALSGAPALHEFASDSALVDTGNPATPGSGGGACEVDDQRGIPRPFDGNEDGDNWCDIGSVEFVIGTVDNIEAYAGSSQMAQVLTAFAEPLQARVFDNFGTPMSGEMVTFTAPATGASGTFFDSGTNETTAITDGSGVATAAEFTANDEIGSYIVEAAVGGVATPAEFSLENYTPVVTSIDVNDGSGQMAEVLTSFVTPLQAIVLDQNSNPLVGETVTFTAPASGASGTFDDSMTNVTTAVTDGDGLATAAGFTANSEAGVYIVEAMVGGVGTPAEFSLENFIYTATTIELYAGSGQSTEVLTLFTDPLQALVRDQFGDPMEDVTVTFTAPVSGASGTFDGSGTNETTADTDASGIVTAADFTANDQAGSYVVEASVGGIALPVEFNLENYILTATTIEYVAGAWQYTSPSTAFATQFQVLVRDQFGDPMDDVTVTFTAPVSGASGAFADSLTYETTAVTDDSGTATAAVFTANAETGAYLVLASVVGIVETIDFQMNNTDVLAWYVKPGGDDDDSCWDPNFACATIYAALHKAGFTPGDTVNVAVGTYTGSGDEVVIIDIDSVISGGWDATFSTQNGFSVLDGEGERRVVTVYNSVTTSLSRLIVENGYRESINGDGAGIRSYGSSNLTLDHCIVRDNIAGGDGGGLFIYGNLELVNSAVYNNEANFWYGGGILLYGTGANYEIRNSTISNNSAITYGGGIHTYRGNLTLSNVTITRNQSEFGGGLYVDVSAAVTVQNSILAENFDEAYQPLDCEGTPVTSNGYNVIGADEGCFSAPAAGDQIGTHEAPIDPRLYNLEFDVNGIAIYPIKIDSPALDAGNPAAAGSGGGACEAVDQRGVVRPQDGDGDLNAICDVGAYEFDPADPPDPPGDWYVAPGGDDENTCDDPGSPCETIAGTMAKDGFAEDSTIYLAVGTYIDTGDEVVLIEKDMTLSGGWDAGFSTQVGTSIIDGANARRGITILPWMDVIIEYVDVQNGLVAEQGGGIFNAGQLTYRYGDICNNSAAEQGGGLFVEAGGSALLEDSLVCDNSVTDDLGSHGGGGGIANAGFLTLRNTTIDSNTALLSYGGGVRSARSSSTYPLLMIEDSVVSNNTGEAAGGIYIRSAFDLDGVTVTGNTASHGAGMYFYQDPDGLGSSMSSIANSAFTNNTSSGNGGGLSIYLDGYVDFEVHNSTFANNTADGRGGGISFSKDYHSPSTTLLLNNATIIQNNAEYGGGLATWDDGITLQNSIISNNHASEQSPECYSPYGDVTIASGGFNILSDPTDCPFAATADDTLQVYPLLVPLEDGGGVLIAYQPAHSSPAVDNGNPAPPGSGGGACEAEDQLGTTRPVGTACDIGAIEGSILNIKWTYTANNDIYLPGVLLCTDDAPECTDGGDPHADAAHLHAQQTYDFFLTHHGRDSLDGVGGPIISSVHVSTGYANAAWIGMQIFYGDAYGFPLADDVVAHELTHGVTQYSSNLFYYYQSGAINESFSDLWGEFVDLTNGTGNDDVSVRWMMGEDVSGMGAIRDMADPTTFGDPDRMTSPNYFLGPIDAYYGTGDNGGVHTNSGVNNKAVYLMTDGDTFNGQTVSGLGIDKVAAIYYEVQTSLLTSASDYGDLYNALYQGCLNLVGGADGITIDDCTEVQQATLAVEMNQQPTAGYIRKAEICGGGLVPVDLFYDDFESGLSNWVGGYDIGGNNWYTDSGYATSGTYSLYGDDYLVYPSNSWVSMADDVYLEPGEEIFLYFDHAFGFEDPNYDGGILEYSVNGGNTWFNADYLHDAGAQYTHTIFPTGGNPSAGEWAFTGDSHGYVSSRYDLGYLAGNNVRFRWRISLDPVVYDWGWWIDDVRIYTCEIGSDPPYTPSNPTPADAASDVPILTDLSWDGGDPDGDPVTYDVYFEKDDPTPDVLVCDDVSSSACDPGDLEVGTTYYWYVIASDGVLFSTGPVWSFDTSAVPANPPPVDFDGDLKTDPAKFSASTGTLSYLESSTSTWQDVDMGTGTYDYVSRSDFDGDGKTDPAKFVTAAGALWYLESSSSTWQGIYMGPGSYQLVTGSDFDGDGQTDPALFITDGGANALWYLESSTTTWQGIYMGPGSYELVEGSDFDGDGATDPALFYSDGGANALWYLESGTSTWQGAYMGPGTYEMVPASDFDGDGETDPALFDSASASLWYLQSSTGTWAGQYMGTGTYDYVAASDFDGDGATDPAEFVPGTEMLWWIRSSDSVWDGVWMGSGSYEVVN